MNILYVKNNSERAKEFQLKTIIYEDNGQKYVKKQILCPEALPHLKKMKESYKQITSLILNQNIKLAKIIDESEDSLTFEFIEGISLETKLNTAKKVGQKASAKIIDAYKELIQNGFETKTFDSTSMVNKEFKKLFGEDDYSQLDGELCLEGISNIDLIFSNIIFKENDIYLIDYEWIFDCNIPLNYIMFRALHEHNDLHWKMEKHLIDYIIVGKDGFLNVQDNYAHPRLEGLAHIQEKDDEIKNQKMVIADKDLVITNKENHIQTQEKIQKSILHDKEMHIRHQTKIQKSILNDKEIHIQNQEICIQNQEIHIQNQEICIQNQEICIQNQEICIQNQEIHINELNLLAESMRIKSRVKNIIKKVLPSFVLNGLRTLKNIPTSKQEMKIINTYVFHEPIIDNFVKKEISSFSKTPLISIIMPVYNVEPKWLDLAIKSIENQWYDHWELCIADDKSTNQDTIDYLKKIKHPKIKIVFLDKNVNISAASNEALKLTSGEYIALMDNDDEITPDALYEMVKAVNVTGAEFIYSDEDKLEMDGTYSDPNFKPEFAPDMFLAHNYLSHLGIVKKELITKVGGWEVGLEGSQDYDLYLKVLEQTNKIHHISKILYHWRKIPGSTAAEYGDKSYAQEAGRKALENAMKRRNIPVTVKNGQTPGTYKVDYEIIGTPLVSIVIPFKDKPELLKTCIESILEKSTYTNFEIIGISNNSSENEIFVEMDKLKALDKRISFHEYNIDFNYSKINNYAVEKYANGEHILFLNNDIEIITPTWIEEMLMYSQQVQNGAIGAKLYFPNDTIQHAGIVLTPKTIHSAILMYQGFNKDHYGYGSRLRCVNNYSAVTAACLMVKRELFNKVGGFDEKKLSIAYNDVDLCLTLQETGYKNIWTPYCEAYHHESVSRGHERSVKDVERREKEKWHLKDKHPEIFSLGDPFYNKRLTRFGVGSELDDSVTIHYETVNGIPFYEEIISTQNIRVKMHPNVCIFSHFDADNEVKDYVIYYLKALSQFIDIIFVSTAEGLNQESLKPIEGYCKDIIVKKNIGYDFGAWKTGLDYLGTDIIHYDQLILCNDSVYGPLFDLETIFEKMKNHDLWSITDNHEIEYHLQSYFMVYTKKAFSHKVFQGFWKDLKIYHNKQILIENNEIGFSQAMMMSGLSYSSYYMAKDKNYVNVLQYYWDILVTKHQFPFIKKEVLTTNPLQLDTAHWEKTIQSSSDYPSENIVIP
jgi:GT2 family glycosyltransferase